MERTSQSESVPRSRRWVLKKALDLSLLGATTAALAACRIDQAPNRPEPPQKKPTPPTETTAAPEQAKTPETQTERIAAIEAYLSQRLESLPRITLTSQHTEVAGMYFVPSHTSIEYGKKVLTNQDTYLESNANNLPDKTLLEDEEFSLEWKSAPDSYAQVLTASEGYLRSSTESEVFDLTDFIQDFSDKIPLPALISIVYTFFGETPPELTSFSDQAVSSPDTIAAPKVTAPLLDLNSDPVVASNTFQSTMNMSDIAPAFYSRPHEEKSEEELQELKTVFDLFETYITNLTNHTSEHANNATVSVQAGTWFIAGDREENTWLLADSGQGTPNKRISASGFLITTNTGLATVPTQGTSKKFWLSNERLDLSDSAFKDAWFFTLLSQLDIPHDVLKNAIRFSVEDTTDTPKNIEAVSLLSPSTDIDERESATLKKLLEEQSQK